MTEFEEAGVLANRVLERPNADPDDDLSMLARQLLRSREREETEKKRRVYYQDIVYAVCNSLDRCFAKRKGSLTVCGTIEEPSRQVQELLVEVERRCFEWAKVKTILQGEGEAGPHNLEWEAMCSQVANIASRIGVARLPESIRDELNALLNKWRMWAAAREIR